MSDNGGVHTREGMEAMFHGPRGEKGEPGAGITPGAKRAVIYLFIFTVLLAAAALFVGVREITALRAQEQAQCKFNADLGSAPVAAAPGGRPSLLGVTIVSDARVAWHGLGCAGTLPSPAPSFAHWAKVYHLPYR